MTFLDTGLRLKLREPSIIELIYRRMVEIDSAITGVRTAYSYDAHNLPPGQLPAGDLPIVINMPPLFTTEMSNGLQLVSYWYVQKIIFFAPVEFGISLENLGRILPMISAFRDTYSQALLLNELPGVHHIEYCPARQNMPGMTLGQCGPKIVEWGNVRYHGLELWLGIMTREVGGVST